MECPPLADVLRDVQSVLSEHQISLVSFFIDALQDPRSLLAKELIARIADVLAALRPHLDGGSAMELGRFFATIASSELLELSKDQLWRFSASKLSAGQLRDFSVKRMSRRITSAAPGFSTFLHSVCVGKAMNEVAADDNEPEAEPDQILEIVCSSVRYLD